MRKSGLGYKAVSPRLLDNINHWSTMIGHGQSVRHDSITKNRQTHSKGGKGHVAPKQHVGKSKPQRTHIAINWHSTHSGGGGGLSKRVMMQMTKRPC